MNERLDHIDKAKGILIILAVIGHIWQAGYVHNLIYSFHMPAFFVISGMLMQHTKAYERKYTKFLLGRIYAFGIPFVFIEILGVLTDILRHGVTLNIKGYIFNTLTLHYNDGNLWFLVDLFLIEAVFVAAKKLARKNWLVATICVLLFTLSLLLPANRSGYIDTLISSFKNLFFFAAGFFGKKYFEKRNTIATIVTCLVPPLVALLFGKYTSWCLSLANAAFLISGVAGTYVILRFSELRFSRYLSRILAGAGKNSITIYGTHHIIYAAVGVLLGITDFATTPLWAGVIMLLVVATVELPTIYIINRWLPFLAGKRYQKQPILHN